MTKAQAGDIIRIKNARDGADFKNGDVFEVDLRFSSMGACDDDTLLTMTEEVVGDEEYEIIKRHPSNIPKETRESIAKQLIFDCAVELFYGYEGLSNEQIGIKLLNINDYLDSEKVE